MTGDKTDEVVLYTFALSPFSQRIAIALEEKGISYKKRLVDLFNKDEEFLALNPVHKMVPVLVHRGHAVAESHVILEYIDEEWPNKPLLLPKDTFQRSVARFWVDYINRFIATMSDLVLANGYQWENAKLKSVAQFKELDKALGAEASRGTPYFLGDQLGIVDICFAPIVPMIGPIFEKIGGFKFPTVEECPRIYAWMEALEKHPTCVATKFDIAACYQLSDMVFQHSRHKTVWTSDGHLDEVPAEEVPADAW